MEEHEGILGLRETILTHKTPVSCVSESDQFSLESRAPRDAILFLLLDVLTGHVSGIVQQRDVPLHDLVAELTSPYAVFIL